MTVRMTLEFWKVVEVVGSVEVATSEMRTLTSTFEG